jgi:hypothetical protein
LVSLREEGGLDGVGNGIEAVVVDCTAGAEVTKRTEVIAGLEDAEDDIDVDDSDDDDEVGFGVISDTTDVPGMALESAL